MGTALPTALRPLACISALPELNRISSTKVTTSRSWSCLICTWFAAIWVWNCWFDARYCCSVRHLSLDYILGYWLLIRRKIAFRPAIVLFDRYVYDMTIDPRRFRIGVPGWVARGFTRWVPKPDLILC